MNGLPQASTYRQHSTSHTALPSVATTEQVQPSPTAIPRENEQASVPQTSFDIHAYPPQDLLRLLASLLTQIASTNDKLDAASSSHASSPSSPTSPEPHNTVWSSLTTASRSALSTPSSTLTFHARNIPTISLEAYLLRILRYCPTTNEVFLSLLVYFDRMTKLTSEATGRSFVIDSYNIHRLVIAGVTVASKFFSDVFYTNSRYAKVGGLPLAELNQLELQFLLLNNFTLVIPKDEMQRY
ncbi:cyclin-domain-containing protein, partial [Lentinula raphanica]